MRARRLPVVDEYVEDGRYALHLGATVIALSELGSAVLEEIGPAWTELDAVTDALVARFGAPVDRDASSVTREAVEDLRTQGVLEVDEDGVAGRDEPTAP